MTETNKTYKLMALQQKVSLGKTAQKLSKITQDYNSAKSTQTKIETLLEEKQTSISQASSKFHLQSEIWFGTELADQLEMIQSQNTLMERELDALQQAVIQKEHKYRKISDKADAQKRLETQQREEKRDQYSRPRPSSR